MSDFLDFKLSKSFLEKYTKLSPPFGPLGLVVYTRTYSRPIYEENRTEEWWETIKRVVEGTYAIQKTHCKKLKLPWNDNKAQKSAQEMYDLMYNMKFLPPGRGLWMMGSSYVEQRGSASLNNCAMVSTREINIDFADPFCFLMDMSMLGVGVSGDTKGAGKVNIVEPRIGEYTFVVEDSREGWVELVRTHLNAYVGKGTLPSNVDYSKVRPYGAPIKGFGGTSSGPAPLERLLQDVHIILTPLINQSITSTAIVDLFNVIGKCVVSGNVRRSAELLLGEATDTEFLNLKDPNLNKKFLDEWRWASNNSIFGTIGMDYTDIATRIAKNGEPGILYLDTAKQYSRLCDLPDNKDNKIAGTNPCQPGWATVLTPNGISTISALKVGDIIWSGSQWTRVTNLWSTGIKPVYGYHTNAGVFYGTENHRVVSEGEKIEVGLADNIDTITGPTPQRRSIEVNCVIDGLLLGDGGIHKASNNLIGLYIGKKDHDYFSSEIKERIIRHRPGISEEFYEVEPSLITDVDLVKTFLRRVPTVYLQASRNSVMSFLRGLYSANGSIVGQRITLKSASFGLIQDVQMMLSSIGIRSYYTINKAHEVEFSNGTYECKESYDLNISTDRKKFRELIGFIQKDKMEKLIQVCETTGTSKYSNGKTKITYDIHSKQFIANEEVFDLTVEASEHTYWTGGLLVSNCAEQSLESFELCTLVETFPARHDTYEEYERTLKFAYLYAKTVTLLPTHNERTNAVLLRNRRIGTSQSGIAQSFQKHGVREHFRWCDEGYKYLRRLDKIYSDWLCIPESIKITSVKPSGSVSLLPGATPGIHFPYAEYYWRTIRMDSNSDLCVALKKANYTIVEDKQTPNTSIVYFPVKEENFLCSRENMSMWQQLEIAAQMQHYWADNQVSVTITFKPEEASSIKVALELYETRLKSVSFLPLEEHGYEHAPYQKISKETYETEIKKLKTLKLKTTESEGFNQKGCDGDTCIIS
jgi:ribonucleotide reductase alpha subunit